MNTTQLLIFDRYKIRKHWGKSDSEVAEYSQELKSWIKTQNFPEMPSDHMIEVFLTNCKYRIDTTKENIKAYYNIRKHIPEIYKASNPKLEVMKDVWSMGYYCPLPRMLDDLYRICVICLDPNCDNFVAARYFSNVMNVFEIRICEDLSLSEIVIVDYRMLKWSHMIKFSPFLIKKLLYISETVAKNRLKQIHILEASTYMNILVNIGKKLMKKKIADRIHIHNNIESLYDYVPKNLLPEEYGGTEKSLEELSALWRKKVEEYQSRFDMWDKEMGY